MADFIYMPNPAVIPRFLTHIQGAGVPSRVTTRYLVEVGFTSNNDRSLIPVLKGLGFIDQTGTPTDLWRAYRDRSHSRRVLADAIRKSYAPLFQTYPDAYRRDDEALRNFIRARSDFSDYTLGVAVRTFKFLCEASDFSEATTQSAPDATHGLHSASAQVADTILPSPPRPSGLSSVNINIELHLPATNDSTIYEKLFEAMRKHLLSDG